MLVKPDTDLSQFEGKTVNITKIDGTTVSGEVLDFSENRLTVKLNNDGRTIGIAKAFCRLIDESEKTEEPTEQMEK